MEAVRVESLGSKLALRITARDHTLTADEPTDEGGDNQGPQPFELLLASLGGCTAMTILLYARRHQWPLDAVDVELSHERLPRTQETLAPNQAGDAPNDLIHIYVVLKGALTAEQKERLAQIADHCPVHRTLVHPPKIVMEVDSVA